MLPVQLPSLPIAQRAEGYGIPWHYIDGNDLLTVYETMRDATEYIRSGNGPVLVETQTYRYFGHSKSDRNLYRSKDEIDDWRDNKDPITRFKDHLIENAIINEETAEEINNEALHNHRSRSRFRRSLPRTQIHPL